MGVRIERFPEYGVTLSVFTGIITPEILREHMSALQPEDLARRITYADPTSDLSGVDIAAFPELKREFIVRQEPLLAGKPGFSAIVCKGKSGRLTPDFWASYFGQDSSYPVRVMAFETLEAACAWLALPEAGCRAVVEAAVGPRRAPTGPAFASAQHDR